MAAKRKRRGRGLGRFPRVAGNRMKQRKGSRRGGGRKRRVVGGGRVSGKRVLKNTPVQLIPQTFQSL